MKGPGRGLAQWFRACTAPTEDLSLFPTPVLGSLWPPVNPSPGCLTPPDSAGSHSHSMYTQTYTYTYSHSMHTHIHILTQHVHTHTYTHTAWTHLLTQHKHIHILTQHAHTHTDYSHSMYTETHTYIHSLTQHAHTDTQVHTFTHIACIHIQTYTHTACTYTHTYTRGNVPAHPVSLGIAGVSSLPFRPCSLLSGIPFQVSPQGKAGTLWHLISQQVLQYARGAMRTPLSSFQEIHPRTLQLVLL